MITYLVRTVASQGRPNTESCLGRLQMCLCWLFLRRSGSPTRAVRFTTRGHCSTCGERRWAREPAGGAGPGAAGAPRPLAALHRMVLYIQFGWQRKNQKVTLPALLWHLCVTAGELGVCQGPGVKPGEVTQVLLPAPMGQGPGGCWGLSGSVVLLRC